MADYIYKLIIWLYVEVILIAAAVKGDSKGSRITLEMIEQNFDDASIDPNTNIPESMERSLHSNQTILYSKNNNIYLWNISRGRESSSILIKTDALTSFHQISSQMFLVRERSSVKVYQLSNEMDSITQKVTLVCTHHGCCKNLNIRCRESGSETLGPIAVNYSSTSHVVFYVDSSSIYSVNLSANALPTSSAFDGVDGRATALAFNSNYSTAYIFFEEDSAISFNLQTHKSSPVQLHGLSNPVEQAISIDDEGVLLCRTSQDELLLVDINTGNHSGVYNETTHLPCRGDCVGKSIRIRAMVDINNQGYLFAVNNDLKLIKLKYKVTIIHDDVNNITDTDTVTVPSNSTTTTATATATTTTATTTTAISGERIDEVPTIFGCSSAAMVLILGMFSAILWVMYTKKRRRLIQKFPPPRRRRIRSVTDHVIEDFAMSTREQRDDQRATPQHDRERDVRTSNNQNLSQAPSHSLPTQHRPPLEHIRSNDAYVPDEPYYEEVLGNVVSPISVQASVPRPPYVPLRGPDLPAIPSAVSTAPHSSELSNNSPSIEEPAYCDNDLAPLDRDAEYADYSYAVEPRSLSNSSDEPSAFTSTRRSLSHNRESDRELDVRPCHSDILSQVPSPPLPTQQIPPRECMRTNNGDVPDWPYYEEVLEKVERPIRIQASVPCPPYVPPKVSNLPPIPSAVNTAQHRSELSNNSPSIEESAYCDNDQVPHDHDGLYVDYAYAVEPRSLTNSSDEPSTFTARRSLSQNSESDREPDVRPSHNDNLFQAPLPPLPTQHRPPLEHTRSNDAYAPNGPYYEEVLENVERPIHIQAPVPRPLYVPPRTSTLPPIPNAVNTAQHSSELSRNSPCTEDSLYCDSSPAPLDRDAVEPRPLSNSSDESSAFTSVWRSLSHTLSGVLQTISAEFEKPSDSEITF